MSVCSSKALCLVLGSGDVHDICKYLLTGHVLLMFKNREDPHSERATVQSQDLYILTLHQNSFMNVQRALKSFSSLILNDMYG